MLLRLLLPSIIINYPFTRESGGGRKGKEVLVGEGGWIEIKEGMGGGEKRACYIQKDCSGEEEESYK